MQNQVRGLLTGRHNAIRTFMPNGTVKFFNAGKGFGFITPDGGGKDVFFPSASLGTVNAASLKPGQRLTFEEAPDAKGPKAVNLVLVATPVAPKPAKAPAPRADAPLTLTLYCDPSDDASHDALEGLRAAGHEPRIVDYIATPPAKDELRRVSALLRDTNQSLVRRYDHLFHELRLDDRFISENEFWEAIVEHPGLINGPVVTSSAKAVVYRDERSLALFLAAGVPVAKPKVLSQGLMNLMMGKAPPPKPEPVAVVPVAKAAAKSAEPVEEAAVKKLVVPKRARAEAPVTKAAAKPAPKAKPVAKKAAAPKTAKAPAKKAVARKKK
jgi:arsenate reductase (glutaredoxin)